MSPVAQISRVLVAVELDGASASALKMAGVLASAWDAEITVFHSAVQEAPAYFTADQLDALEAEREQSRTQTANQLRAFAAQHVTRPIRVAVEEGPPADAILRMAPSFDLLVVGTRRRHGSQRWWLGSVAEEVVRHSPRPVLVVPARAIVPDTGRPPTILAAGDDVARAAAWVDVLRITLGGNVVRSPDIHQCAPESLHNADLIVLSIATDGDTEAQFGALAQVLKECVHPVLFVPSADGMGESSAS